MDKKICVYIGEELKRYGFGNGHPFGAERMVAFWNEMVRQGLDKDVCILRPVQAEEEDIEQFHTHEYVEFVKKQSEVGVGYLDYGDTPAFKGVYEAASYVVGTSLNALKKIMDGDCLRAFIPVAGLHHARRNSAAGFCVFNDCGVVIEVLEKRYNLERIAYVDIDAHHGDGVYYSFEDDHRLFIADIHEDGNYLYPGTGSAEERGIGSAKGTKLNIPLLPFSGDETFFNIWPQVEEFLKHAKPEFIIFQCGADGISGDPITHLSYSEAVHAHAAESLCRIADEFCSGRILAMGGGGYNLKNLSKAWCAVLRAFLIDPKITEDTPGW
ncbi:MAG: acetoin utilization protein AcuC [Nitrospirae bacterium]|nr:MAG: acetoin utilization protein AcuC [Nitrospirota bacterium]